MSGPSGRTPGPPTVWRLILTLVVRGVGAEFVLGDIEEDHREVYRAHGARAAARWYRHQALTTAWAWLARRRSRSMGKTTRGGGDGMEGMIRGIRHAVRGLRRAPGFTLSTVLVLGLGLGGSAAVLGLTTSLLSPLPFPDPARLVSVWQTKNGVERAVAPGNYLDWRRSAQSFDGLAAYASRSVSITVDGTATRARVEEVSGNFFAVLGVEPELGGGFEPGLDTDYPDRVAVLSHALWEQSFNRDPEVLGRSFQVDDLTYQVAGVMPTGFAFPNAGEQAWIRSPREAPAIRGFRGDLTQLRDAWYFQVVGRLASGTELAKAREEMTAIAVRLEELYPRDNADAGVLIRPLLDETISGFGATLAVLGAAVLLVLLAAAVNVAHLTLARTAAQRQALSVRVALGAGRGAVLRHVLAEAWLLGVMGGVAGVGLAMVTVRWGVVLFGPFLPRADSVMVSPGTAAAAVFLGLALETLLALLAYRAIDPARWHVGVASPRARGLGTKGREGLVAAQVAAAIALGVGATLLGRSLMRLADVDLGFDTRDLVTVRVAVPDARLRPYPERLQTLRTLAEGL
ncbi:MAG: ABC transporter permease, partial [Gemmatimonadota bacterium]